MSEVQKDKYGVPEHVPRIHQPHEGLSPEKARELDLASWQMANQKKEETNG